MDTKKIEPMLSDEQPPRINDKAPQMVQDMWKAIEKRPSPHDNNFNYVHVDTAIQIANRHLAKTRAVVQSLVNGINDARFALFAAGKTELANQLAEIELRAKNELNITPKP